MTTSTPPRSDHPIIDHSNPSGGEDQPFSSVRRQDGHLYVLGRIRYAADAVTHEMQHVVFARSTIAHARLDEVDVSGAAALSGVTAVLTGADLASLGTMPLSVDPAAMGGNTVAVDYLAVNRLRHVGQPVAAIVARDLTVARRAAGLVQVVAHREPAVLDVDAALAPGAPLVYEEWGSNLVLDATVGNGGNFDDPPPAPGLALLEGTISLRRSSAAALERRAFQVVWDHDRRELRWHGTTQSPHVLRNTLAEALGIEETRVHVVAPAQGGSFGVKQVGNPDEVLVALLARKLRIPLRFEETREESLLIGQKEQTIEYRASYDDSGRVRSVRVRITADLGNMTATASLIMPFVGALGIPSGYAVDDVAVQWRVVATHKPPTGPCRPFGKEIPALVMEGLMDDVARATALDPMVVRRLNWLASDVFPYDMPTGLQIDSGNYPGLADRLGQVFDYDAACAERDRRRAEGEVVGVGLGFELMPETGDAPGALGGAWDTATVRMDPSGRVTILTGVTSPGNGNETGIAQIAARQLGVNASEVRVVQGDTDSCPFGLGNLSSRGIVTGGGATHLAAGDVAATLRRVGAAMLSCEAGDLKLVEGHLRHRSNAEMVLPIPVVASSLLRLNYIVAPGVEPSLESTRTFTMPNIRHLPDARGNVNIYSTYSNALYGCLVSVDPETGQVNLLRHGLVHDCGEIINPDLVEGQLRGGAVMGYGAALTEEIPYDAEGRSEVTGFKTYLLPRAPDVPRLPMGHQVTSSPFSPLGTKGAGESGMACVMAGLRGAINDAFAPRGARADVLPMTAVRLHSHLQMAEGVVG